mmetsp:Transcript_59688/g.96675  ORF Transcript_59688/g.96675 Transcript_59688/m.96675 type:complete len:159 (-) Transcript_59688:10-486(-)
MKRGNQSVAVETQSAIISPSLNHPTTHFTASLAILFEADLETICFFTKHHRNVHTMLPCHMCPSVRLYHMCMFCSCALRLNRRCDNFGACAAGTICHDSHADNTLRLLAVDKTLNLLSPLQFCRPQKLLQQPTAFNQRIINECVGGQATEQGDYRQRA